MHPPTIKQNHEMIEKLNINTNLTIFETFVLFFLHAMI